MVKRNFIYKVLLILLFFIYPSISKAYSVLTHEALIDAVWDKYFVPLLKTKYPSLNDSLLKEAHAYAYGGAVAPDMGYYPLGSKLFTNLVHYVRSGDFTSTLINEAYNPNEYAFALGWLCHYYADIYGHQLGVNVSVPISYPKDKRKYGSVVTYEQDEVAHKRVEFSFDVTETAKGNYASKVYHEFIGFKVADSVLDRACYKTYNLHLNDIFSNFSRAVGTFRWAVKDFFPALTKAAWATRHSAIKKQYPTVTSRKFHYRMSRANYNKEYGRERDRPRFFSFLFAGLIKILPKIGPLAPLKFKPPSPEVEKLYIQSFDTTQLHYSNTLTALRSHTPPLTDKDFDTGNDTEPGEYKLTDKTYCDLLLTLTDKNRQYINAALQQNILHFFENGIVLSQQKEERREKLSRALIELRTMPAGYGN